MSKYVFFVTKSQYEEFRQMGYEGEMTILEPMPEGKKPIVNHKHYMKFQRVKRNNG